MEKKAKLQEILNNAPENFKAIAVDGNTILVESAEFTTSASFTLAKQIMELFGLDEENVSFMLSRGPIPEEGVHVKREQ